MVRAFACAILGKKIEALGGWNFGRYFGGYALGGIDMALWDIQGKACGQPLYKLLGGKIRSRSECFKYLHHDQPDRMAAEAAAAVAQGYGTLYCKYTDIEHLKTALTDIRQAVGRDPKLWVDFNGTLSPGFAVQFLRELEPLGLTIVEQPVHAGNLEGMAHVRKSISAQVLAHESCWTPAQALNVIKAGAADIISVDTRMTWGLWACKKVAGMAEAAGMPVIYHSPVEMGIAHAAALHLIASTPNFIMANQCMYDWVADDYITGGKLPFEGPFMRVPEGPGLGVALDPAKMQKYHRHYRDKGMYPVFGFDPVELASAPPPMFPAY